MELGSNFEIDISNLQYVEDNIYQYLHNYHTIYLDSGRSAIRVLNKILQKGVILLPFYICSSVIKNYEKDFSIRFYKVKKDFSIDLEDLKSKLDTDVTVVYVMNYFGEIQDNRVLEFLREKKKEYGFTIVEDTTHSIFTNPNVIGDYCICSLRKWFPVPDGGALYSTIELNHNLLQDTLEKNSALKLEAMILKKWYIEKKVQYNAIYRDIFEKEEHQLDMQEKVYQISAISQRLLQCFSVNEMIQKRKKNYQELKAFLTTNGFENILKTEEMIPIAYPIYIKGRDHFRTYLIEHQVYCAVHWPLEGIEHEDYEEAEDISRNIISLPIDQRYDKKHMKYLEEVIKQYDGEKS